MRKLLIVMVCALAWLLLWAGSVAAQYSYIWPLELAVIDGEGNPVNVAELGCAYSEGTDENGVQGAPLEQLSSCTNCSVYSCTFESPYSGMGGYIQSTLLDYTTTVPGGAWQVVQGNLTGVLWGDNDDPWETRHITFVLDLELEPTPIPTLTPYPTPTPPITSGETITGLSSGLGITFTQYYGRLSAEGVIPDFGLDSSLWLNAGRKWLQFINQGNLLWVLGGVLLAGLVLRWAIDKVKNPR